MPPPAVLAQYDQIMPGAANRILSMAETAATGDIKIRDKLADAEIERAKTGQAWAAFLTLVAIGAAIFFFVDGNQRTDRLPRRLVLPADGAGPAGGPRIHLRQGRL